MSDMHPHWHATSDDEPRPVDRKTPAAASGVRIPVAAASRMPAAIVGILFFTAIGVTAMGGWQVFTGQVSETTGGSSAANSSSSLSVIEIRITSAGFTPPSVTARPGQKITWINEQAIPHIITSQTLRDGSGSYLNTPAIFPGSKESFKIGKRESNRTHTYASTTDQTLTGKIIVSKTGESPSSDGSNASKTVALGSLDDVPLISGQGGSSRATATRSSSAKSTSSAAAVAGSKSSSTAPAAAPPPTAAQELPDAAGNPIYGAAPPSQNTLDSYYAQVPPIDDTPSPFPIDQNTLPPPNPHPATQPDTGPGLWVAILMSILAFSWMTRNCFMRIGKHHPW